MKTHEHRPQQLNKQPASAGTLGGKGTLPTQHTTFNTLDNWAIKKPPNQKGKGPERKVIGSWPEHVYNTLGYIPLYSIITSVLAG